MVSQYIGMHIKGFSWNMVHMTWICKISCIDLLNLQPQVLSVCFSRRYLSTLQETPPQTTQQHPGGQYRESQEQHHTKIAQSLCDCYQEIE